MQNLSKLSKGNRELVNLAGQHAKDRYKEKFISIGGAVRTKSGKIYTGINLKYRVRNASACGEAMAIYAALNDGETKLDTVVGVKYFPETESFEIVNGCGWCRQLFTYNTPLSVIIDNDGIVDVAEAEELMPYAFI
jgi:cytidine deaminase